MLINKTLYGYNDVTIVPSVISEIKHRKECNTFDNNGFLPIFTAPMSSVVCEDNFELFEKNHINAILPRNINLENRIKYALKNKWAAFSLNEFQELFCDEKYIESYIKRHKKVLIDVANGHMQQIYDLVKKSKEIYGDTIEIMVGNIANPETYIEAANSGVDYIRCSIGSGSCCITSSNLGIHYGIASLIDEIYKIKLMLAEKQPIETLPKIIADGGIRNYSDIIKSLAIGADFVMVGGLFASLIESAGKTFIEDKNGDIVELYPLEYHNIIHENNAFFIKDKYDSTRVRVVEQVFKTCYGMASSDGQISINGKKTKTSEGITKTIKATTSINKWSENMVDYMRSAMSYLNIKDYTYLPNATVMIMSPSLKESINK